MKKQTPITTATARERETDARGFSLMSELANASQKLTALEGSLNRTLTLIERGEYGDVSSDALDNIFYAKDKIIEAKEAVETNNQ